ncbi:MAG: hypothetical protein JWO41_40 [Candidatus Saccharibacteria bacterium]|nr:hypothetical protein [Candidatus Saccharibacteria bacterium]
MLFQDGSPKSGYTIIEVMIFMAISGIMFMMAATFISGKQGAAQFRQSMNDMNGQVQAIMNEVANGEYSSLGANNCTASTVTNSAPTIKAGTRPQGSNGGCTFLGKVVQFHLNSSPSALSTDDTQFAIYTAVARQTNVTTTDSVDSFANASPMVVDTKATGNPASVNLTRTPITSFSLQFTNAFLCTTDCAVSSTPIGAFGFFGSFGGYVSKAATNQSSAQQIITAAVPGTYSAAYFNEGDMADKLNSKLPTIGTSDVVVGGKLILLCFKYGPKYGSITIGGSSGQAQTTTINMGYSTPCAK